MCLTSVRPGTDSSKLCKYQQVSLLHLKSREAEGSDLFGTDTFEMSSLWNVAGMRGEGGGKGGWRGQDGTLISSSMGVKEKLEHHPGTMGKAIHPGHPSLHPYCVSGRLSGLLEMLLSSHLVA